MIRNNYNLAIRIIFLIILSKNIYTKNNSIDILSKYYDKNSIYTQYLIAKNNMNNNQGPNLCLNLISRLEDSSIKNDLIREILEYDMDKNFYIDFIDKFRLLHNTTITQNESCGYEYSRLILDNNYKIKSDYYLYYSNNAPWCGRLVKLQYKLHHISQKQLDLFILNLIINKDIDIINNIFGSQIFHNKTNAYNFVLKVQNLSKKNPYIADNVFKKRLLEPTIHYYLANYIASLYAKKQNFYIAQMLYTKYPINTYNYNIIEWNAKTKLANYRWDKLIDYIQNEMPSYLQQKSSWQYWLAISYQNMNKPNNARYHFSKIANRGYDYYSLLARSQLQQPVRFIKKLPPIIKFDNKNIESRVLDLIRLYQIGIDTNNNDIRTIATFEWYYLVRIANQIDLYNMSGIAKNNGMWELSIIASNKLANNYLYLSYPEPFFKIYQKYAKLYNIDISYLLAISKQESRFRNFVTAFDGGIGLMQIMPNTAKYIHKSAKIKKCNTIDTECNINLGAWYLSNLYQKFGDIIYATSSYNAGPKRSVMWQTNLNFLDKTIQIELIPISITHDYIQNVLVNKAVYDYKIKNNNNFDFVNYINTLQTKPNNKIYLTDDNTDKDKIL